MFYNLPNCKVISYSTHMKKYDLTQEEVVSYFGSEEGCTVYSAAKNRYLVFYNDLDNYYKTRLKKREERKRKEKENRDATVISNYFSVIVEDSPCCC